MREATTRIGGRLAGAPYDQQMRDFVTDRLPELQQRLDAYLEATSGVSLGP